MLRRTSFLTAAVLLILQAAPAHAQDPSAAKPGLPPLSPGVPVPPINLVPTPPPVIAYPPIPSEIVNPRWIRAPQPEFPELAMNAGVETGQVRLMCLARVDRTLSDCEVVSETPADHGFAAAALAAIAEARISPRLIDGRPSEARFTFMVNFRMAPEDAPVPPAPAAKTGK